MTTQLIEDEIIFEVTVQEDSTSAHLMVPVDTQWGRLRDWFGSIKLVHQIALQTFQNRSQVSADCVIGGFIYSVASSPTLIKLPSSALGNKVNEITTWIAEGYSDAEDEDGQSLILSGTDFDVKDDGTVWITNLGKTDVVLTAEQVHRVPTSIELFLHPMDDDDTVGMVISYRDDEFNGRHLTLV